MEKSLEFPQKLKIELAIPPLGIHPKKMKTRYQKDIYTPMIIVVLFTIAKIQK